MSDLSSVSNSVAVEGQSVFKEGRKHDCASLGQCGPPGFLLVLSVSSALPDRAG